jgi:uncharacterized membrane protein
LSNTSRSQAGAGGAKALIWWMAGVAAVGLAISIYLTTVHYSNVPLVCLGTTGCEEVNRSIYSEVAGVAVALLGGGAYLVILLTLWGENLSILKTQEAVLAQFGISLAGTLYSIYLTYVELFILGSVCIWCLMSLVAVTALLAFSIVRLRWLLAAEAPSPARARRR